MKKWYLFIALCLLPLACKTPTKLKPHAPIVDVESQIVMVSSVKEAIDTQASFLVSNAQGIKTQVNAGLSIRPEDQILELIGIKADSVDKGARIILAETGKLGGVQEQLEKVEKDFALVQKDFSDSQKMVKERDDTITKLGTVQAEELEKKDEEIAKLKDSMTAKIKLWFTIGTFIFIGLAATSLGLGFYMAKPKLFIFAPAFIACASFTYFFGKYIKEIMYVGVCIGILLIAYAIWKWKEDNDSLKIHKKALTEEVATIEKVSTEVWLQIKDLFKDKTNVSADTKKLVDLARIDIKEKDTIL